MNYFLKASKRTYRNLSKEWDNEDGYVQPIISFRGLLILIVALVVICGWTIINA